MIDDASIPGTIQRENAYRYARAKVGSLAS